MPQSLQSQRCPEDMRCRPFVIMSVSKCQGSPSLTACLGLVDFAALFIMSNIAQTLSVPAGFC